MAKTNPLVLTILIVVGAIVAFNYLQPATDSDGVDLGTVIAGDIKLYAKDTHVPSTSITAADENATVIEDGQTTAGLIQYGQNTTFLEKTDSLQLTALQMFTHIRQMQGILMFLSEIIIGE